MSEQVWSAYLLMGLTLVALVAHEIVFSVLGVEEPVFWFLAVACMGLFLGWLVFISLGFVTGREPNDMWKLAGLALVGLLGSVVKLSPILMAMFALVGMLGLKQIGGAKRAVLGLILGVEGLLVFLNESDITLAYEPNMWGEYLLMGLAGLVGILLIAEWVRGGNE